MRRSVATIVGTLAGTTLLIGAKLGATQMGDPGATNAADPLAAGQQVAAASPAAQPASSAPRGAPTASRKTTRTRQSPTRAATTKAASGLRDGTFTGAGATERYGTITVSATISGGRLTNASASCGGCGGTSRSISSGAFPTLTQEALAAQSARIATVSGATYTSSAYRASLQSALDAAKA
jgi:uncharacterized protein with FMN-binding domain